MIKMKKLLCCLGICALAVVGGVTAMSTSKTVNAAAEGSTFTMLGGSIRLNETTPGIRFQASISNEEYQAIVNPDSATYDATAVFGMMIAPVDYMTGIEAGEDYIVELAKKELSVSPIIHYSQPWQKEAEEGEPVDTNWYINGSISNVLYENSNRDFFGIAFIRTGEAGSYKYTYPQLDSIDAMCRSMSEIAIKAREDKTWTYSDDQYKIIDKYIARGVNLANGADKDATPTVTVSLAKARSMYLVGETFDLAASFAPTALDLKIEYTTSDPTVAKITGSTVEILGEGTAEIMATVRNYGTTLDITPATMSIMAGTLELTAPNYMAVGSAKQLSVTFSGMEVPSVVYSAENMNVNGASLTPTKAGATTITANVSYEGVTATLSKDVKVIDFGNTTGTTFDLATDLSLWQYRNTNEDTDVTITYENNVGDGRATPYAFNALKYSRPQNNGEYRKTTGNLLYLDPEIISLAKELGYTTFSFEVLTKDNPSGKESTAFTMYNVKADGSLMWKGNNADNIIWKGHNTTIRWKRYNINLSDEKVFEGAGFGFGTYGQDLYLAKVEFSGADISEYAKSYLTESATAGQTEIASEELLQKMFTSVSNTSTLSFGTDAGEGYVKLTKSGYLSQNYLTYNQLKLSAEWIMAAKKLGYTRIRIGFDSTLSSYGTASVLRMGNDGKIYGASQSSSGYWTKTGAGGVTINISKLEDGESIVFACTGGQLAIRKIYFMTGNATLGYWNYDANMA